MHGHKLINSSSVTKREKKTESCELHAWTDNAGGGRESHDMMRSRFHAIPPCMQIK